MEGPDGSAGGPLFGQMETPNWSAGGPRQWGKWRALIGQQVDLYIEANRGL